jgi:ribonuclease E
MAVRVEADVKLISPDFAIERFKTATRAVPDSRAIVMAGSADLMPDEEEIVEEEASEVLEVEEDAPEAVEAAPAAPGASEDDRPRKKRRRASSSAQRRARAPAGRDHVR